MPVASCTWIFIPHNNCFFLEYFISKESFISKNGGFDSSLHSREEASSTSDADFFEVKEGQKFVFISEDDLKETADVSFAVETPVLENDKAFVIGEAEWEGRFSIYHNAMYDSEMKTYFIYYRCMHRSADLEEDGLTFNEKKATCVVTSQDGIHFERPELSIFPDANGESTNIIGKGSSFHNLMVFRSAGREGEKKYMAIGGAHGVTKSDSGVYLFGSNDAIHFEKLKETPILTEADDISHELPSHFDSLNTVAWDKFRHIYWIWARTNAKSDSKEVVWRQEQVYVMDDILSGKHLPATLTTYDNKRNYQHYTTCVSLVPMAEGSSYFVGFPNPYPLYGSSLAMSRNGKQFRHPLGLDVEYVPDPFVDTRGSPNYENYSYRQCCVPGVVPSPDGTRWYFYQYVSLHHYATPRQAGENVGFLRAYSIPNWGFTYVHSEEGHFFTKPMIVTASFPGKRASLHFMARRMSKDKDQSQVSSSISFQLYHYSNLKQSTQAKQAYSTEKANKLLWSSGPCPVNEHDDSVREYDVNSESKLKLVTALSSIPLDEKTFIVWKITLRHAALHGFWMYDD